MYIMWSGISWCLQQLPRSSRIDPTGKNDPERDINQVTKKQQAGLPVKVKQGAVRSKSNQGAVRSKSNQGAVRSKSNQKSFKIQIMENKVLCTQRTMSATAIKLHTKRDLPNTAELCPNFRRPVSFYLSNKINK